MNATSTAAVFLVVLALIVGGMPAMVGDGDNSEPARLAYQTPGGTLTAATPQLPYDTNVRTADARELNPADCTVAPRPRENLLQVFSTLPVSGRRMPPGFVSLTQEVYDDLQEVFFQWQACRDFGTIWQQAALQSDEELRWWMYRSPFLGGPATNTPYSESTITEILDGWEAVDESERSDAAVNEDTFVRDVQVILPSVAFADTTGKYVCASYTLNKPVNNSSTGGPVTNGIPMLFVHQDGMWRLDSCT